MRFAEHACFDSGSMPSACAGSVSHDSHGLPTDAGPAPPVFTALLRSRWPLHRTNTNTDIGRKTGPNSKNLWAARRHAAVGALRARCRSVGKPTGCAPLRSPAAGARAPSGSASLSAYELRAGARGPYRESVLPRGSVGGAHESEADVVVGVVRAVAAADGHGRVHRDVVPVATSIDAAGA